VVSNSVFITVVLGVMAGNVAMLGIVVKAIGDRIGDLASRMDRAESRADERHEVYMAKFDGIAETLARFDRRLEDGH
jgi:hypothetical protein